MGDSCNGLLLDWGGSANKGATLSSFFSDSHTSLAIQKKLSYYLISFVVDPLGAAAELVMTVVMMRREVRLRVRRRLRLLLDIMEMTEEVQTRRMFI